MQEKLEKIFYSMTPEFFRKSQVVSQKPESAATPRILTSPLYMKFITTKLAFYFWTVEMQDAGKVRKGVITTVTILLSR
jgi:hypothetical protein